MITPRFIIIAILLVSIAAVACLVQNTLYNPSQHRGALLRYEISELEPPAPYFLDTMRVDYAGLKKTFAQHPKIWSPLVPGAPTQGPQASGPNFFAILKDVTPSKRKEMKMGDVLKIHVITPAHPRGQWLGIGETIHGCKIIAITPDYLVVEKYKGKNRYAFKLHRK